MGFNFKKISALATSALMIGMTAGVAAAANYPAPFVENGASNVALVVGSAADALDGIQAAAIDNDLHSRIGGASSSDSDTVVSGGDSYKFEKSSTKFHIGKGTRDIVAVSLGDDHLPNLLADGKFVDDDNDEFDYTQKIDVENLTLGMWEDDDYKEDVPTIGFRITSGDLLNYTIDFSDEPYFNDLPTATLPLLGKEYYILSVASTNASITLLDSAVTEVITEGETKTVIVDGTSYEVSVSFIDSSEVKLEVNGELTNSIDEAQTYKLNDGTYVGIKDIMYSSKDTGVSSVEFSLGNGKIVLTDGSNIEINEEQEDDLTVAFTNSSNHQLSTIVISWEASDEVFIAPDQEATMPAFEAVKFTYAGEYYPAMEEIGVKPGSDTYWILDDFPLKSGPADIALLYTNGSGIAGIGKDSDDLLRTDNDTNIYFYDNTDEYFVASWSDGSDGESYLMKATSFKIENSVNKTTIQYYKNGGWVDAKSEAEAGDTFSLGNVELTVTSVNKVNKTVLITRGNANVNFNTLYSKEGMKVYLPFYGTMADGNDTTHPQGMLNLSALANGYTNSTGHTIASWYLYFDGEDKNENIAGGKEFYMTLDETSLKAHVSDITGESVTFIEDGDTDVFYSVIYDETAPYLKWDKSGDEYSATVTYHGGESYGELFLTAPEVTVTPGEGPGTPVSPYDGIVIADSEVASYNTKNLLIVGGSCINTAAASLVGGNYCGTEWQDNTDVGPGQFLIKGYAAGDQTLTSGIALLVAGYNKEDTVNAAKYLMTQTVDTTKAYKGTSSTSADLVVEGTAE